MAENESLDVRFARLDERQVAMGKVIDEIKDNHLVHIANDITSLQKGQDKINNRLAYWGGGLAVIIILLQIYTTIRAAQPQTTSSSIIPLSSISAPR